MVKVKSALRAGVNSGFGVMGFGASDAVSGLRFCPQQGEAGGHEVSPSFELTLSNAQPLPTPTIGYCPGVQWQQQDCCLLLLPRTHPAWQGEAGSSSTPLLNDTGTQRPSPLTTEVSLGLDRDAALHQ